MEQPRSRYLMCKPAYFDVAYVINPWMEGNISAISAQRAKRQWGWLHRTIASLADVVLVNPQPGVPDMPFIANAGVVLEDRVVLSRFLYPERQGEEPYFERWFQEHGFHVHKLPTDLPFEGAGDALLDRCMPVLWVGHGHRSSPKAVPYLRDWLGIEVLPLQLIDARFYHLDTCFCPLEGGCLLYYPPAFDDASLHMITDRVAPKLRIPVDDADALDFACNAVNIGDTIILNRASPGLKDRLASHGFKVIETELSEFMKAGGSAKCLTLRLDEHCLDDTVNGCASKRVGVARDRG